MVGQEVDIGQFEPAQFEGGVVFAKGLHLGVNLILGQGHLFGRLLYFKRGFSIICIICIGRCWVRSFGLTMLVGRLLYSWGRLLSGRRSGAGRRFIFLRSSRCCGLGIRPCDGHLVRFHVVVPFWILRFGIPTQWAIIPIIFCRCRILRVSVVDIIVVVPGQLLIVRFTGKKGPQPCRNLWVRDRPEGIGRGHCQDRARYAQGKTAPLRQPQSYRANKVVIAPARDQPRFHIKTQGQQPHGPRQQQRGHKQASQRPAQVGQAFGRKQPHTCGSHPHPKQWRGNPKPAPHEGIGPARAQGPQQVAETAFAGYRVTLDQADIGGSRQDRARACQDHESAQGEGHDSHPLLYPGITQPSCALFPRLLALQPLGVPLFLADTAVFLALFPPAHFLLFSGSRSAFASARLGRYFLHGGRFHLVQSAVPRRSLGFGIP